MWINISLKYIDSVEDKGLICGSIVDITSQKQVDFELEKYRNAVICAKKQNATVLIIDNEASDSAFIRSIFKDGFVVIEAEDDKKAIDIIYRNEGIDIILLDMSTTADEGIRFLRARKEDARLSSIPVIIITSDGGVKAQTESIEFDAEDYIVKPFVPEAVLKRINHVLDSRRMIGRMINDYREDNITAVNNFQQDVWSLKDDVKKL